jgi:hypothetical protein
VRRAADLIERQVIPNRARFGKAGEVPRARHSGMW